MYDSVFRTVVRQQSKIVKGDIILMTKAPDNPWLMYVKNYFCHSYSTQCREAMGRFVALDKSKIQKGSTSIPTEMQAWLSYASTEGAQK